MKLGMDLELATAGSSVKVLRLVISFELLGGTGMITEAKEAF